METSQDLWRHDDPVSGIHRAITRECLPLSLRDHHTSADVSPSVLQQRILTLLLKVPAARRRVAKELDDATKEIEDKLIARPSNLTTNESLPTYGKDRQWIKEELYRLQRLTPGGSHNATAKGIANSIDTQDLTGHEEAASDADGQLAWKSGKVSGAVYHGGQDLSDLIAEAIKLFLVSNPVSWR